MKVDKAVCTEAMTDAESAISYENLLSTLVQKKILAIKRECEAKKVEKQRRKQQTCLASLLFRKHHEHETKTDEKMMSTAVNTIDGNEGTSCGGCGSGAGRGDVTVTVEDDDYDGDEPSKVSVDTEYHQPYSSNSSISQQATMTDANPDDEEDDDDNGSSPNNLADNQATSLSLSVCSADAAAIAINLSEINEILDSESSAIRTDDTKSPGEHKGNDNNTTIVATTTTAAAAVAIQTIDTTQSVQKSSDSYEMRKNSIEIALPSSTSTKYDDNMTTVNIESSGSQPVAPERTTTAATMTTVAPGASPEAVTNSKSSSIISQIEIDVNDECNAKQKISTSHSKISGSDAITVSSDFIKRATASSAPPSTSSTITTVDVVASAPPPPQSDHEKRQLQRRQITHVFEAKSISAQCSPIFAQRMPTFTGKFIFCLYGLCACGRFCVFVCV